MKDKCGRVPVLDGLRGISLLLVLLGHLAGTRGFPLATGQLRAAFLASLGVRVFLVISGFLISRLLFIEQETKGSIGLGSFYFRRIFRIMVPYYSFLAVVLAAEHLGWLQLAPGDMVHAVTYTTNYHHGGAWWLAHTWSLAVEEQFYLLWPLILVAVGTRRGLWVAAAYVLAAPFGRLFVWYFQPEWHASIGHTFFTSADAIACGCLLAGVRERLWLSARYRALLNARWFFLVPLAAIAVGGVLDDRPRLAFTIGSLCLNLGLALGLDRCMRFPWRRATRVLSWPAITMVGRTSYSIYLWQQIFLCRSSDSMLNAFPLNLIATAAVSLAAYYLIEQPSLTARVALEQRLVRLFRRKTAEFPPTPPQRVAA